MKFILGMVFLFASGPDVQTQRFETFDACIQTGNVIHTQARLSGIPVVGMCVEEKHLKEKDLGDPEVL